MEALYVRLLVRHMMRATILLALEQERQLVIHTVM